MAFPKNLYKYFDDQKYAEAMVQRGNVKIGTYESFRVMENDKARGDPNDGAFIADFHIKEGKDFTKNHPTTVPFVSNLVPNLEEGSKDIYFTNCTLLPPDRYMYCLSTELSNNVAKEFNAVACVEIRRAIRFWHRLGRVLTDRGIIDREMQAAGSVKYYKPPFDWQNS
jgi:hypothetical protein